MIDGKRRGKHRGARSLARGVVASVTQHGLPRALIGKTGNVKIAGVGTERITRGCVIIFIKWLRAERGKDWAEHDSSDVQAYLEMRAEVVVQATLDADRLSLQRVHSFEIPFIVSKLPTQIVPRAYLSIHVSALCKFSDGDLSLCVAIAADAGLRAAEFLTIATIDVFDEDVRPWHGARFKGRTEPFEIFCVIGKGGQARRVAIAKHLAIRLHKKRLRCPRKFKDREVEGLQYFDLLGGQLLSHNFSQLSLSLLRFSTGFHGLRHHFVQRRMLELQVAGLAWKDALQVVANETGHHSVTNTKKYLR